MLNSSSYEPTSRLNPVSQKLGDENYFKWSFEMEMYLTKEDLWDNCLYTEDEYEDLLESANSPLKPKSKKKTTLTSTSSTTKTISIADPTTDQIEKAMKLFKERDRKCRAMIVC